MAKYVCLLACFLVIGRCASAQSDQPWLSPLWLNLYQFEKNLFGQYKSDIDSQLFYFSSQGRTSPRAEYLAAQKAFQTTTPSWGSTKAPAACAFPARKRILEKLSGEKTPSPACPELEEWIGQIDAKEASIVFAGAYSGNPASILGHTFLRFYGSKDKELGQDLLSYSVGFLAVPNPEDNSLTYMAKGLMGGYPGFYQIEPHYMKVGLYNSSESRDLWEWRLNLNQQEVELLLQHIWELHLNAHAPYYFIDENCSHRLIKAISVVRPISGLGNIVIPGETIRLAQASNALTGEIKYRPSILRKRNYRLELMSKHQLEKYKVALTSLKELKNTKDPLVLDALIDHWTHKNLKEATKLPEDQALLMANTLLTRSKVKSSFTPQIDNTTIQNHYNLKPITSGHKQRNFSLMADPRALSSAYSFTYLSGLHPSWMITTGYDNVHQVEYLGFHYQKQTSTSYSSLLKDEWTAILAKIKGLSPLNSTDKTWSWGFEASVQNHCLICDKHDESPLVNISGLAGGSLIKGRSGVYLLPQIQVKVWDNNGLQVALPAGFLLGASAEHHQYKLLAEMQLLWTQRTLQTSFEVNYTQAITQATSLRANYREDSVYSRKTSSLLQLGFGYFF